MKWLDSRGNFEIHRERFSPTFHLNSFHLTHFARAPITRGFLGTARRKSRVLKCAFIVSAIGGGRRISDNKMRVHEGLNMDVGLKMHVVQTVIYGDGTVHARIFAWESSARNLFSAWPWCAARG